MKVYKRLSELTYEQKCHLVWRLGTKTYCGLETACLIVGGNHSDVMIDEIFKEFGMTQRRAKIHANKVQNDHYLK